MLPRLRRRHSPGFTLPELLIGVVLSGLSIAAVATAILTHLRATDRLLWDSQSRRDLARLNVLIGSEVAESCTMQRGASPTSCDPPATSPCPGAASSDLRLLIPIQASPASAPVTRVVRYYLSGTQLLRDGPRILTGGRLDPANDRNGALLLDGVTLFNPVTGDDCRSVTLTVTTAIPNTGTSRTTTHGFRSGSRHFLP